MNAPVRTHEPGTPSTVVGFLVVAACVLACTLPVIGGLLAGSFVDRVLDSPVWIAVVVGAAAAVAIAVGRRRARGGSDVC